MGLVIILLIATYLSAKCPVYFAPAMDLDMYNHPSTLDSFHKLKQFGNTIIPAESGELASGLSGEGRMAEPENIITFLENDVLDRNYHLKGKKISNHCRSNIRSHRSCLVLLEIILPVKWGLILANEAANNGSRGNFGFGTYTFNSLNTFSH